MVDPNQEQEKAQGALNEKARLKFFDEKKKKKPVEEELDEMVSISKKDWDKMRS